LAADTEPDVNGTVEDHVDAQSCRPGAAPKEGRCVRKEKQFIRFVDEALAGLPPTAALLWLTLFRFAKDGIAKVSQDATLKAEMAFDCMDACIREAMYEERMKLAAQTCDAGRVLVPETPPEVLAAMEAAIEEAMDEAIELAIDEAIDEG
jgi:hypothetical protein